MDPVIKVTKINGRFHIRLFQPDQTLHSECACALKEDISFCCKYLLRWYDKLGGDSKMADAARMRNKNHTTTGKVWLNIHLLGYAQRVAEGLQKRNTK